MVGQIVGQKSEPVGCRDGVEKRGNVYYLRWRVPAEFAEVEPRGEINRSLRTRDPAEARSRAALAKDALRKDWAARALTARRGPTVDAFQSSISVLRDWGISYVPIADLLAGPVEDIVRRLNAVDAADPASAVIPAVLGTLKTPVVMISEMPAIHEERNAKSLAAKTPDQLRQWRNKYRNAAASFVELVGDKPVHEITEDDAAVYARGWTARVETGEITANHAGKRIRFLRQMIDEYHALVGTVPSRRANPLEGFKVKREKSFGASNAGGKAPLPMDWVRRLVDGRILGGMRSPQAEAIAIVCAETGCRQSEIYNLPPEDIRLNATIPHILIRHVTEGPHRREVKNSASVRAIPLLGRALEVMRRHPEGFPAYRGKGGFSATVNAHLARRKLFPAGNFSLGALRHTFEDRARAAKLDNEERAFLMGHSVGKLRGRPVYGAGLELALRALLYELIAFPTETWTPRPHAEVWTQIDLELDKLGFRTR